MENLDIILAREYWLTKTGEKKYPHEFDDEHLANTIRFLHRSARRFRLEQARTMCNLIHRTGSVGVDIEQYYKVFRRQMDECLGDLDDMHWLKQKSKIYNMLVDEAKYRNEDYSEVSTRTKYVGKVEARSNFVKKFAILLNT